VQIYRYLAGIIHDPIGRSGYVVASMYLVLAFVYDGEIAASTFAARVTTSASLSNSVRTYLI